MDETFTLLPLHIDPSTKAVSCSNHSSPALANELNKLIQTHRALLSLETSSPAPPPPLPLNPKRSAAIQKMREQGNASLAKRHASGGGGGGGGHPSQQQQQHVHEAIRLYTYAIEMALGRPPWEPAGIVRDELALLYSNRAQAYIGLQAWPEGAADAEASVEMKPAPGQGKAWWRRGRCLLEMGRIDEAEEWVNKAMEVEAASGSGGGAEGGADLKSLKADIEARKSRQKEREKKRQG